MNKISHTFQYGQHTVTLETGEIARQADGAVIVDIEGTKLLVTAVYKKKAEEGRDFFPLTVNYQEKYYAGGKIPGGFFRREARPTEEETLIARLIDRPLRPLFPKGFTHDVQVIVNVLSYNPEVSTDVAAIIGSSAALAISGVPFNGPLGAARVGYKDGEYLLNPSQAMLKSSDLDLVVAGTKDAVLMVESEANLLSEEVMLNAIAYGHEQMQVAIKAITDLCNQVEITPFEWTAPEVDAALKDKVQQLCQSDLTDAYQLSNKMERYAKINAINDSTVERIFSDMGDDCPWDDKTILAYIHNLEKQIVRERVLAGHPRIDGRTTTDVRSIASRVGLLPRTHGSALFTRGETQALVVTTLGTTKDAQMLDGLTGEDRDAFIFHYNFPPFSVGETGMVGSPKRREIGHGRLAKRGVNAVMPSTEEFPYTIRVVSEITESNGSSSMASVCGSSLSLMEAGVPIKDAVAGIAMGLIKEDQTDNYKVLTDILGDEDHLGDMDFKVAGTKDSITALQMDIKIEGITKEIMQQALAQAKDARVYILNEMAKVVNTPNTELSEYAPRYRKMRISTDKIKDVIGKGGATIRSLTEETGANIEIKNDGEVIIATSDNQTAEKVVEMIKNLTAEPEVGTIYDGVVARIADFGAFVTFLPGQDGLVHISKISNDRVENVRDYLKEGQDVKVKVLEVDKSGKVRLSMKPSDLDA